MRKQSYKWLDISSFDMSYLLISKKLYMCDNRRNQGDKINMNNKESFDWAQQIGEEQWLEIKKKYKEKIIDIIGNEIIGDLSYKDIPFSIKILETTNHVTIMKFCIGDYNYIKNVALEWGKKYIFGRYCICVLKSGDNNNKKFAKLIVIETNDVSTQSIINRINIDKRIMDRKTREEVIKRKKDGPGGVISYICDYDELQEALDDLGFKKIEESHNAERITSSIWISSNSILYIYCDINYRIKLIFDNELEMSCFYPVLLTCKKCGHKWYDIPHIHSADFYYGIDKITKCPQCEKEIYDES